MCTPPATDRDSFFAPALESQRSLLMRIIRSCVFDRALHEDAFQEICHAIWHARADYDRTRPFQPWLFGVARRVLADYCRRQRRHSAVMVLDPQHVDATLAAVHELGPAAAVEHRELVGFLRDCLSRLPPERLAAVYRFYFLEESSAEVAASLCRTDEAVRSDLRRARAALKACIQRKLR
ncbi:MAG: sigma-70 family RNA polymerase sigma factor [Phycisphaerae bacterium]